MKKTLLITVIAILLATTIGFIAGRVMGGQTAPEQPAQALADQQAPTTWTCSMHPNIQQPKPGDCPICGMDLIPLDTAGSSDLGPRTLTMSTAARALANIQTSEVERRFPVVTIGLVGELVHDETRLRLLSARFAGRIDALFVNYTGMHIEAGDSVATVFSPELMTAQRELLAAWKADPKSTSAAAARERLLRWDLLPGQIDTIIQSGEPSDQFDLKSPVAGTVIQRHVSEGDYLQTGQSLFQIADLNHLWLMLEAFESDLAMLQYDQHVEFTVHAYPGEFFTGTVAFIAPEIDPQTRTVGVRVNVVNPDGRLRPGMLVRAQVHSRGGEDEPMSPPHNSGQVAGHGAEPPLVVPASAVLRTGRRAVVYVELPDAETPTFEGREIVLGPRAQDLFIVREGLNEGDRVVTNGAFKIDSSLQIKAMPSMMQPPQDEDNNNHDAGSPLALKPGQAADILPAYFDLQTALAADDLPGSQAALRAMMELTGHQGALAGLVHTMLASEGLEGIRRPHFETLSNALIEALRAAPGSLKQPVYLMHCPMVYPDRGADWLQSDNTLLNPYFGASMLRCGEVRGPIPSVDQTSP